MDREREIYRVTIGGSIINVVLLLAKFAAGFFGHSAAMIADAVHSLTDFVTDVVVLLFVRLGSKPVDKDHGYGHGKYETLATAIIGASLLAVGVMIFCSGLSKTWHVISGDTLPSHRGQRGRRQQHPAQGMGLPVYHKGGQEIPFGGSGGQCLASP